MSLKDFRARIDALDDQIVALLDERTRVAGELAVAKRAEQAPTYDPERERDVLDRLARRAASFPPDAVRAVYREIMSACLSVQQPIRVAFLGPPGTFTHAAARTLFGIAAQYSEAATIEGVFDAVRKGDALYGVSPIENSTEGPVTHALDALVQGGVYIRRELVVDVDQCLLSSAPTLTAIERVFSHPQALGQCRTWLARNLPGAQLVQTSSTAGAVREAAADAHGAAIAGRVAAEVYGVPVLREKIQDHPENATRFVMLATEDAPRTGDDKTTLVFSVKDERGALRRVLGIFDDAGVNLSRIESRPSQKKAWDYIFFADVEGHRLDPHVAGALETLRARCPMVKELGSYPRWRPSA